MKIIIPAQEIKVVIPAQEVDVPAIDSLITMLNAQVAINASQATLNADTLRRLDALESQTVEPPVIPPVEPPIEPPTPTDGCKRFPRPAIDVAAFIRRPVNARIVEVSSVTGGLDEDLSKRVQQAQDLPGNITVVIEGGGSFKNQVIIKHHTVFDGSEYFCDTTGTEAVDGTNNSLWYGTFLVQNNVLVEGTWRPPTALLEFFAVARGASRLFTPAQFELLAKVQALTDFGSGTVIWEPQYAINGIPSVTVFQAYEDAVSLSHEKESRGITIMGFHVKGRQTVSDGGMRQTLTFGNCVGGAALYNFLEDTAGIGIQFGGAAIGGKHAADFLMYGNITKGLSAAHTAVVNGRDGRVAENYSFRFGRAGFGGGVTGFDLETNDVSDLAKNIWVEGNLYDYEGSIQNSAGTAIAMQDPGFNSVTNGDCGVVNNWVCGGRMDPENRFMATGIGVGKLNRTSVASNWIFKSGQQAVAMDGLALAYTDAEFKALPNHESLKTYKVYLFQDDIWRLSADHYCRCEDSVVKDNWFDCTAGGGNPTLSLHHTERVEVGPNKLTVRPEVKFGTDMRLQDCFGRDNTAHDNVLNGSEMVPMTSDRC